MHLCLNSELCVKHHHLRSVILRGQLVQSNALMHNEENKSGKVPRTKFRELSNSDSMSLLMFFFFFWSTSPFFLLSFFEKLVIADFQKCL